MRTENETSESTCKNQNTTFQNTRKRSVYSRIYPGIGVLIGIMSLFGSAISIVLLITGAFKVKMILIAILTYQYFFAKKSDLFRKFLKFMRVKDYFDNYNIVYDEDLKKDKSLLACHPHGIVGVGFSLLQGYSDVLYETGVGLVSTVILMLPISGIFARWMGGYAVKKESFESLMKEGKNICFLPGGFEEATITNYDENRVFIKKRKGFIKLALKYGYSVHPVYTFGENKLYYTWNGLESIRLWINKFKFPSTVFCGICLFLPFYNTSLYTVVGKAILLPQIPNPTKEDVSKYHKIYLDSLRDLFERHKGEYGTTDELIFY